jgi:hypothetical protein
LHHFGRHEVEVDAQLRDRGHTRKSTALALEARTAQDEVLAGADRAAGGTDREGLAGSRSHEQGDVDSLLEQGPTADRERDGPCLDPEDTRAAARVRGRGDSGGVARRLSCPRSRAGLGQHPLL